MFAAAVNCCCCAVLCFSLCCVCYYGIFDAACSSSVFSADLVSVLFMFSFGVASGIYQSVLCTMLLQCDRTKSLTPEYSRFGAMILLLLLLLHFRHCCCSVAALLHDAAVDVGGCRFTASILMFCCCVSINVLLYALYHSVQIFEHFSVNLI